MLSALKRIKTYLCNSMYKQRLSDLPVLSIESDFSDSLELDLVVDTFAHKNRRIIICFVTCSVCIHLCSCDTNNYVSFALMSVVLIIML